MERFLYYLLSALLVSLSAILSGAESAFLAVNKLRLTALARRGDKDALRVSRLLENRDTLINTLLVSNDIVNIALSAIWTVLAIESFGENAPFIASLLSTIVLLILGEITPKTICLKRCDTVAYRLSRFMSVLCLIMRPIVFLFTSVGNVALKLRGLDSKKKTATYTKRDIETLISSAQKSGTLKTGPLMNKVFSFTDSLARDIMVKGDSVVTFCEATPLDEVLSCAKVNGYSYFPIWRDDKSAITGVLYLKDLLSAQKKGERVRDAPIRPPLFITGDSKMSWVFSMMEKAGQSFAIVSQKDDALLCGIITKESIARNIFG